MTGQAREEEEESICLKIWTIIDCCIKHLNGYHVMICLLFCSIFFTVLNKTVTIP